MIGLDNESVPTAVFWASMIQNLNMLTNSKLNEKCFQLSVRSPDRNDL
jgi:hypothetical protein